MPGGVELVRTGGVESDLWESLSLKVHGFFFFFPFKTLENPQQYRSVEKNLEGQPEVGHVLGPE